MDFELPEDMVALRDVARRFAEYLRSRSEALQLLAQRLDDAASAKEGERDE